MPERTQSALYPSLASQEATEQAVLAAIFHGLAAHDVSIFHRLSMDDFTHRRHQLVFRAVLDVWADHGRADIVQVTDHLRARERLDGAGGAEYVTALLHASFDSSQFAFHVHRLCMATLRRLTPQLVDAVLHANTKNHENVLSTLRYFVTATSLLLERMDGLTADSQSTG